MQLLESDQELSAADCERAAAPILQKKKSKKQRERTSDRARGKSKGKKKASSRAGSYSGVGSDGSE